MSGLSSSLADAKRSAEAMVKELDDPEADLTSADNNKAVEIKHRSNSPERQSTFSVLRILDVNSRRKEDVTHQINSHQS
jgi:hypothetical protein